jgi:hypothetical protein
MLFLSTRASQWNKVLNWNQDLARGLEDYRALEEDHSLKILYMAGTSIPELSVSNIIWDSMDNEIRKRVPVEMKRGPESYISSPFPSKDDSATTGASGCVFMSHNFKLLF